MTDHRGLIEEAAVYLTSKFARTGQAGGRGSSLVARLADALEQAGSVEVTHRACNAMIEDLRKMLEPTYEIRARAAAAERRVAELETKLSEENIAWLKLDGRWVRAIRWAAALRTQLEYWTTYAGEMKGIMQVVTGERDTLVRDLAAAEARAKSYETGLTWQTTCTNCAGLLGQNYAQYCELEALQIELDEEREKTARDSAAEADTDRLEAERDERGSALAEIETAISDAYDHDCPETDPVEMVRYLLRQLAAAEEERADWKRIVDQNLDASAETVAELERDPDGLDITEEAALHGKVVEAAIAWRDVASGTLTVPPWAHVDVEQALGSAVDALQRRG